MQTITTTHIPVRVSPSPLRSVAQAILATDASATATVARLALGVTMLPHGLQKTVGWFGGYGFTDTMHWFTDTMHVPWIFGFAAIVAESVGALALIAGFATRIAAFGVGAVFVTAVAMIHHQFGFFMNWEGSQSGEGIEYFILGLALVSIVLIRGGGRFSADRALSARFHP